MERNNLSPGSEAIHQAVNDMLSYCQRHIAHPSLLSQYDEAQLLVDDSDPDTIVSRMMAETVMNLKILDQSSLAQQEQFAREAQRQLAEMDPMVQQLLASATTAPHEALRLFDEVDALLRSLPFETGYYRDEWRTLRDEYNAILRLSKDSAGELAGRLLSITSTWPTSGSSLDQAQGFTNLFSDFVSFQPPWLGSRIGDLASKVGAWPEASGFLAEMDRQENVVNQRIASIERRVRELRRALGVAQDSLALSWDAFIGTIVGFVVPNLLVILGVIAIGAWPALIIVVPALIIEIMAAAGFGAVSLYYAWKTKNLKDQLDEAEKELKEAQEYRNLLVATRQKVLEDIQPLQNAAANVEEFTKWTQNTLTRLSAMAVNVAGDDPREMESYIFLRDSAYTAFHTVAGFLQHWSADIS